MVQINNNETYENKTAVSYVRYSTNNQHDESAEAQIRAIEEFAAKNNIKIIYNYKDLGISGTSTKGRDGFNQMIKDSAQGMFDLVLVHKVDRFARSTEDYFSNEKKLNNNGVEVIIVDSPFDNTPVGKMVKTLMVGMAEMFSGNLSSEVAYKNREYARKGHFLGGTAPYGYDSVRITDSMGREYRSVVVNEKEAPAVELIYQMTANHYSAGQIVNKLYNLGYRTRSGNTFTRKTVRDITEKEIYKGTYVFSKTSKYNMEPIIIEDNHEPIVSKELWERVQKIRNKNKEIVASKQKSNYKYMLTGIIYCEECGSAFTGTGGRGRFRYYSCAASRHQHKDFCSNKKYLRKDFIEDELIKLLSQNLFNDKNIEAYTKAISNNLSGIEEEEKRLKELEKDRNKLYRKSKMLIDLLLEGEIDKEQLKEKQQVIKDEIEILEKQIFEISVSLQPVNEHLVKEYLKNIQKNLHKLNGDELEAIIKNVIERIEVGHDKIDVFFKIFSPYPDDDGGNKLKRSCDNDTTRLTKVTLSQKTITFYKRHNGIYIGHVELKR